MPSPYRIPVTQPLKRKAPPPGQKQYTAKAVATAKAKIAAGELHTPLKRSRVEPDELVEGEEEDASGAEGEEGEEETGEEMGES